MKNSKLAFAMVAITLTFLLLTACSEVEPIGADIAVGTTVAATKAPGAMPVAETVVGEDVIDIRGMEKDAAWAKLAETGHYFWGAPDAEKNPWVGEKFAAEAAMGRLAQKQLDEGSVPYLRDLPLDEAEAMLKKVGYYFWDVDYDPRFLYDKELEKFIMGQDTSGNARYSCWLEFEGAKIPDIKVAETSGTAEELDVIKVRARAYIKAAYGATDEELAHPAAINSEIKTEIYYKLDIDLTGLSNEYARIELSKIGRYLLATEVDGEKLMYSCEVNDLRRGGSLINVPRENRLKIDGVVTPITDIPEAQLSEEGNAEVRDWVGHVMFEDDSAERLADYYFGNRDPVTGEPVIYPKWNNPLA